MPKPTRMVEVRLLIPTKPWADLNRLHAEAVAAHPEWKERLFRDFLLQCCLVGATAIYRELHPPPPPPPPSPAHVTGYE